MAGKSPAETLRRAGHSEEDFARKSGSDRRSIQQLGVREGRHGNEGKVSPCQSLLTLNGKGLKPTASVTYVGLAGLGRGQEGRKAASGALLRPRVP